ncbi:MAG: hypothetical protein K6F73_02990 [Lachnospiraceae bacterium]|nr:hypothetical protein [Lachnospiraceae bacterium]
MAASHEKFDNAIGSVKIPILILDNKWHRIFGKMNPTKEIKDLEEELSALLKRQGKLVNENKDLKKIKSNLMSEIVDNIDGVDTRENDESVDKKLNDNKRLINDVNEKLDNNEEELMELPREIDAANRRLMLATMDMCYERLQENTALIDEIAEWVKDIRVQLKKNLVKKQDMELYNAELYSYMHDIFGPVVMELFDMKYVPTIHKPPELKAGAKEGVNTGAQTEEEKKE